MVLSLIAILGLLGQALRLLIIFFTTLITDFQEKLEMNAILFSMEGLKEFGFFLGGCSEFILCLIDNCGIRVMLNCNLELPGNQQRSQGGQFGGPAPNPIFQ